MILNFVSIYAFAALLLLSLLLVIVAQIKKVSKYFTDCTRLLLCSSVRATAAFRSSMLPANRDVLLLYNSIRFILDLNSAERSLPTDFFCMLSFFSSLFYYWIIKGITVHLVDCSTLPKVVDKLFDVEVSKFGP